MGDKEDSWCKTALGVDVNRASYAARSDGRDSGPKASAGDSFYVTGAQKGSLTASVKSIQAAAEAIFKIGTDVEEKGAKKFWFDDKQMLQSAKNLHSTASGLVTLAKALDRGDVNKVPLEKGSQALDYADTVVKAAEAVAAIRSMSLSTQALEDKTNEATVNAWADSIGETFDKAGALIDIIPKGALPGFAVDYYKGLFAAPKVYISAFKTLMAVHYGAIDKEAGLSHADLQAADLGGTGLDWEGDLTFIFSNGYTLPKSTGAVAEFQRYMLAHRKTEGADLWKVTVPVGKALLTTAIARDLSDDDDAKNAWLAYVGNGK